MNGFVLGIDGGGTKTAVCAADLKGKALMPLKTGAININGESRENVRRNLLQILSRTEAYFGGLQSCRAICIGAAGISNHEAKLLLENTVREAGYTGRLIITGDHEIALYGALGLPAGIILVAGTGSVCYGKNTEGREHRTGGFGYLIDDEGSGYAVGRDILAAMVRAHDGRGQKTALGTMVFEQWNVSSIEAVIGFLYRKDTNKRDIAALAPNLTRACSEGDAVALGIARKCSAELLKLIYPAVEHLRLYTCTLAMAGSILQKDPYVRSGFISGIASKYPGIVCKDPENDAAHGAVLMAVKAVEADG